jgi:uncharacterized protein YtpQ (UPF0354 family)
MGWLDFFRGTISRERFANRLIAEMKRSGAHDSLRYNADRFVVERGNGGLVNLANIYQEYNDTPRSSRDEVFRRFVRGCLAMGNFELPSELPDAQHDLLPVVRSRFYFESAALQSQARGSEGLYIPHAIVADHLALSLVYDLPQAMRSIGHDDLERWDTSFYHVLETAKHNLEQLGNVAFANIGNRCFASATGDNYDASRLILLDLIRRLPVRGDYIAMVPNRDSLLVTGSNDQQGLSILCKLARESFQQPRPISTIAMRLEGDDWQSWLPDQDSPLFNIFNELRLRTIAAEYADQAELLIAENCPNVFGAAASAFYVVQDTATQSFTSYCVWTEGRSGLLPKTDVVTLIRSDGTNVGTFAWRRLHQIAGTLMRPQEIYPERWLVQEFPSDRQLRGLGK